MRVLYDLIHIRAAQNWHGPINQDNFKSYASYWIRTARDIASEFDKEGLTETAIAISNIANQQESLIK